MKKFFSKQSHIFLSIAQHPIWTVFLVTLIIHGAVILILHGTHLNVFLSRDQLDYDTWGVQIAQMLKNGTYFYGAVYPFHWYPLIVGWIYALFGSSMMIGSLANGIVAAGSGVLLYLIFKLKGVSRAWSVGGALVISSCYPAFVLHTSILIKESFIIFLMLAIWYVGILLIHKKGYRMVLYMLALSLFLALYDLRFFIGIAAIMGLFIEWLINAPFPWLKRLALGIGMILVAVSITWITSMHSTALSSTSTADYSSLQAVNTIRTMYSKGGATNTDISIFEIHTEPENTSVTFSIPNMIYALATTVVGPFPWQLSLIMYALTIPDAIFIYICIGVIGYALVNIRGFFKSIMPYLIPAAGMYGVLAISINNLGAMVRQRIPAVVAIALIAVYALYCISIQNKNNS